MTVKIEDATIRMLNDLHQIEKECFKEEAFSKQQISYLLRDYNSISLVAREEGKIEGFIIGRIDLVNNQSIGHIMTIDVASAYHRRGIAMKLILEIEAIFKQKGVIESRLDER